MARGVFTASTQISAAALNDCFSPPRCRLTNSANISTTTATAKNLTFDTEVFDSGTMHSTSVNTGRIVVPTGGAGLYMIGANVEFDTNATGWRTLNLMLNTSTVIASHRAITSSASVTTRLSVATIYSLSAGDYLEVQVYQNSGGSLNVLSAADYSPVFYATWMAVTP